MKKLDYFIFGIGTGMLLCLLLLSYAKITYNDGYNRGCLDTINRMNEITVDSTSNMRIVSQKF